VCEGLPVLLVDDWSEVTPERLAHEWAKDRSTDVSRLTLSYWRTQIHGTHS
jgi:hypothetical protein